MFRATDTGWAPWYAVHSDDKGASAPRRHLAYPVLDPRTRLPPRGKIKLPKAAEGEMATKKPISRGTGFQAPDGFGRAIAFRYVSYYE